MRGDLIETFKILNGHYACSLNKMYYLNTLNMICIKNFLKNNAINSLRRNFLTNIGGLQLESLEQYHNQFYH